MSGKLERIFEKLTGLDPRRDLQPPLAGQALAKEIKRRRSGGQPCPPGNPCIKEVDIWDCGSDADREPYTIFVAKRSDGSTVASYQFVRSPNTTEEIQTIASSLPPSEWFPFDPEHPSEAGI